MPRHRFGQVRGVEMTKYVVLYHMPASAMDDVPEQSPEDMQKAMEPWMKWAADCGDALVDLGTPLGNGQAISQGGSTPSNKDVAGYSILEAESMDAAKALLQGHPHITWNEACSIEVHEAMPLPGS